MGFDVSADAYDRFMGRYSIPLAPVFVDFAEGGSPPSRCWEAAEALDPAAPGEDERPGTRRHQLGALLRRAGLGDLEETALSVAVAHATFDDWWQPFELGVGPAAADLSTQGPPARERLRERCRALLPDAPFVITAVAFAARAVVATADHRGERAHA